MPKKSYTIEDINSLKPKNSRLTAVVFSTPYLDKDNNKRVKVFARCICGTIKEVPGRNIVSGKTLSCGCLVTERLFGKGHSLEKINNILPANSKLKVIKYVRSYINPRGRLVRMVLCKCSCGNKFTVAGQAVISGNTLSCGCYKIESTIKRLTKYTHTIPKLRNMYSAMIDRCYNKFCSSYRSYGAKGVTVCDEWRKSYQTFLDWALANGWKPGLSLDKDKLSTGNKKIYSPETCCFLTMEENRSYVKAPCHTYTYKGFTGSLKEIGKKFNVNPDLVYQRMKVFNVSIEIAVETKLNHLKKLKRELRIIQPIKRN